MACEQFKDPTKRSLRATMKEMRASYPSPQYDQMIAFTPVWALGDLARLRGFGPDLRARLYVTHNTQAPTCNGHVTLLFVA